jgi:hypothetical protein
MDQQKQPVVSTDSKKPYEKPQVVDLGSVESLTQIHHGKECSGMPKVFA